jgi:hypothetical protein|tara:strand:+ start:3981 stop:4247 length:267 start_codon:yes stop_codon:yes gene_type:complete
MTNRRDVLEEAIVTVAEREKSHGDAETFANNLAEIWSITTGVKIPAWKVLLMLGQLKDARIISGDFTHDDHWVDGCGYRALGCEIANL